MGNTVKLCSGADAVKKFQKAGWSVARQRGSYVMMTNPEYQWTLAIPQHKELGPGLLQKLLKQAGLTVEKFNKL